MKKHLRKILLAALGCLTLGLLTSCTDWEEAAFLTYTCPESLRLVTTETISDGSVQDVLDAMELSEEDALSVLKDGQVLFTSFLPSTDANAEKADKFPVEIFMTVDTSMYIRNVFNFNYLTDEQREELFKEFLESSPDQEGYEIVATEAVLKGDIYWIYYEYSHTSGEVTQYVRQYTTMYNGFSYTLSAVSAHPLDERATVALDGLLSSVGFSETLEAVYEYKPQLTFTDTFVRFLKENWLTMLIVALVTVAATSGVMVYYNYGKKKQGGRKNDGVVRGEYLR